VVEFSNGMPKMVSTINSIILYMSPLSFVLLLPACVLFYVALSILVYLLILFATKNFDLKELEMT
jgi:hypothetical protein